MFTSGQLAAASGLSLRTIRYHVAHEWLKPEPKAPGVRGHRFSERRAKAWMKLHFPTKALPQVAQ